LSTLAVVFLLACDRGSAGFHANDISGSVLGEDFQLQDGSGAVRHLADFRGQVVVVFFGYTRCPDVCPTNLVRLAAARRLLGREAKRVQVIFITLDPERDTPKQLSDFVAWFDPTFLGLWGDPATIAETASAFKVSYDKHDAGPALGYTIDHFAGSFAYDPAGRLRLLIAQDEPSQQIAEDIRLLLAEQ
jgi:protein SCO1/2